MTGINLIPESRRQARQRRARVQRWLGAAGGYVALLAGLWAAAVVWLMPLEEQLDQQLTALDEQIEYASEQANATRQLVVEARANLEANQVIAGRPDWSLLLALLAARVGEDVVLNECAVEPGGFLADPGQHGAAPTPAGAGKAHFVLRLGGWARSQAEVSQFVLRLEQLAMFDRVMLMDTRREPFKTGSAAGFRIVCVMHVGEDAEQ